MWNKITYLESKARLQGVWNNEYIDNMDEITEEHVDLFMGIPLEYAMFLIVTCNEFRQQCIRNCVRQGNGRIRVSPATAFDLNAVKKLDLFLFYRSRTKRLAAENKELTAAATDGGEEKTADDGDEEKTGDDGDEAKTGDDGSGSSTTSAPSRVARPSARRSST